MNFKTIQSKKQHDSPKKKATEFYNMWFKNEASSKKEDWNRKQLTK